MITTNPINIRAAKIIFIFFVFFKTFAAYSQIYGCTDPTANNYNSSATVNDGSCTYDIVNYTPPVVIDQISDTLKESSGLQWAGNSLWSFNDRGGDADLYRIDTVSKAILQVVHLADATNTDWEELTFDGTYFYVGDFGNNLNGDRSNLKIYKFPFSAIPDYTSDFEVTISAAQIEVINFTYRNQPVPLETAPLDSTRFDCEAMLVLDGKIHLFSKNWIDLTSTHYIINSTMAGNYVADSLETYNTGYLVTAAAKSPAKNAIVLLGYLNTGLRSHYMSLLYDYSNGKYFNGNKKKINLPGAVEMGQAEGITFKNDTYGYISNERVETLFTINQKLHSFDISNFAPANVLAVDLADFNVVKTNGADKIIWNFNLPVKNIEIQQSADGIHFNILKTSAVSASGSFINKSENSINYYRIAWKQDDGGYKYSKIISIKSELSNLITHLLLKTNGELSFTLNSNQEENFSFKLLATDGKELSQVTKHSYRPGSNKISFSKKNTLNGIVFLIAYDGDKQKTTTQLHVMQ